MATEIRADTEEILDVTTMDLHGLHVEEDAPTDLMEDDDEPVDGSLAELIDAFAEAYNAHDLDGTVDLLSGDAELPGMGGDVPGFPAALGRLWDDRPNAILARGALGDQPVGLLWDASDDRGWCRVALLSFDLDGSTDLLGLIELVEGHILVDEADGEAPESEFVEGVRWDEWEEGAGS